MHLNKLSTGALMRLTILASLNLLVGRFVGYWWLLHPMSFLILVTLDLGLYALMVYTGTLNKTLIAMMLGGLAGVLAVIAYNNVHAPHFFVGSFGSLAEWIEEFTSEVIGLFPNAGFTPPPKQFWGAYGTEIAHIVVDAMGLGMIVASGLVARVLQARWRRREPPALVPSS